MTPEEIRKRKTELTEDRTTKVREAQALLELAEGESRDLTEDEATRYDGLVREIDELGKRAERLDRQDALLTPPAQTAKPRPGVGPVLDLSERDMGRYSLTRAINALVSRRWDGAGFEKDCSIEIGKRLGAEPEGFFVPYDILNRAGKLRGLETRELTKAGDGGDLVATDHLAGSFIDLLRPRSAVLALGATVLDGLVGDVSIPRLASGTAGEWLATEGSSDVSGTDPVFDNVTLTPKTVAGKVPVTRKMLKQSSPAVDGLIADDLAAAIATAIDVAAINGPGTGGAPTGILNVSGIGGVTTGGGLDWSEVVEFETDVAVANGDLGRLAYLTHPVVVGIAKTIERATNTGLFLMDSNGRMNGYPVARSGNVPTNLGTGTNERAMIFGDWSALLVGAWGVLDISQDPYTLGDRGTLVLRAFQDVDVAVRHAASFSAAVDI